MQPIIRGARRRLPNRRLAETFELEVAGLKYTATVGRFPDGSIGEMFLNNHKSAEPDAKSDGAGQGSFFSDEIPFAPEVR
jgi:hypothetical protein